MRVKLQFEGHFVECVDVDARRCCFEIPEGATKVADLGAAILETFQLPTPCVLCLDDGFALLPFQSVSIVGRDDILSVAPREGDPPSPRVAGHKRPPAVSPAIEPPSRRRRASTAAIEARAHIFDNKLQDDGDAAQNGAPCAPEKAAGLPLQSTSATSTTTSSGSTSTSTPSSSMGTTTSSSASSSGGLSSSSNTSTSSSSSSSSSSSDDTSTRGGSSAPMVLQAVPAAAAAPGSAPSARASRNARRKAKVRMLKRQGLWKPAAARNDARRAAPAATAPQSTPGAQDAGSDPLQVTASMPQHKRRNRRRTGREAGPGTRVVFAGDEPAEPAPEGDAGAGRDLAKCPPLEGGLQVGDVVAYRITEILPGGPSVSELRAGQVAEIDGPAAITLEPWPPGRVPDYAAPPQDEDDEDDAYVDGAWRNLECCPYDEHGTLTVSPDFLQDLRLVQRGSAPAADAPEQHTPQDPPPAHEPAAPGAQVPSVVSPELRRRTAELRASLDLLIAHAATTRVCDADKAPRGAGSISALDGLRRGDRGSPPRDAARGAAAVPAGGGGAVGGADDAVEEGREGSIAERRPVRASAVRAAAAISGGTPARARAQRGRRGGVGGGLKPRPGVRRAAVGPLLSALRRSDKADGLFE